jgi:phosphoglycolate phosphatase-like HAD superfamily hydrolase
LRGLALDLDTTLGDTRPLWCAWRDDLSRRARVELDLPEDRGAAAVALDAAVGNWRPLLERFAEDHAPVYLRPQADANAALRRLRVAGASLGAFTDAPLELARVALAQLGAARLLDAVETGSDALAQLLERLGPDALVVRTREELLRAAT